MAAVPLPRLPRAMRLGTLADLPFTVGLQKRHANLVGWMPTPLAGRWWGG